MELEEPAVKYYLKMDAETYLEWERLQEYKHEYVDGNIIAMSGASFKHNRVLTNIIANIQPRLKGKPCNIFPSDMRVSVKSKASYFYPDATIVCGEPELADDHYKDNLKNPSAIFEILSPSTEDYDIGKKFFFYMQIDSLKEYITIDSLSKHVRIGKRQPDGAWKFEEHTDAEGSFFIDTVQLEVSTSDVYEGVKL